MDSDKITKLMYPRENCLDHCGKIERYKYIPAPTNKNDWDI